MPFLRHRGVARYGRSFPDAMAHRRNRRFRRGGFAPPRDTRLGARLPYLSASPIVAPLPPFGPKAPPQRATPVRASLAKQTTPTSLLLPKVDVSSCTGCGVCASICPAGAISVAPTAKVDAARCTGCGLCVNHCPTGAMSWQ